MKHTTSRLLFSYWDGLRRERSAPDRQEIEPGRIRHILADTFVLAKDRGEPAAFRLVGTRCSALFGLDLKGSGFAALWPATQRHEPERWLAIVAEEGFGVVLGCLGTSRSGFTLPVEILLLPLRHRGRTNVRMLGSLSPSSLPAWLGRDALVRLETTSARIVDTGRLGDEAFTQPAEMARRLVVVEGGRTGPGQESRT